MPTQTYVPLATVTLASAQATVTFSSISQAYRDLIVVIDIGYSSLGASTAYASSRINGDTGANYYRVQMQGNGSTASSGNLNETFVNYLSSVTTTQRSMVKVDYFDYSATDKHKTILLRENNGNVDTVAGCVRWANTSAITTISIYEYSGFSFAAGSTFSLYGIGA